jgi:hypothetical protein
MVAPPHAPQVEVLRDPSLVGKPLAILQQYVSPPTRSPAPDGTLAARIAQAAGCLKRASLAASSHANAWKLWASRPALTVVSEKPPARLR